MKNLLILAIAAAAAASAQVGFDRILQSDKEPQNWLTYSGNYNSQRYSKLTQITPDNVKNLELQWVYQAHSLEKYEATPLVVDGVMYTVQNPDDVVALDPATVSDTLGVLLKYQDDIAKLEGSKVKELLDEVKSELRAAE